MKVEKKHSVEEKMLSLAEEWLHSME
jgi:hypothetical protein